MTSITTPSNQKVSIDPYSSKLFDFDNVSSKIYLARSINNLLNVFGQDVVIDGLMPIDLSYINDVLSITVLPGKCIIDTTLIEFPDPITITINCSNFNDSGSILLLINFKFTESVHSNTAKIKLVYIDSTYTVTYPEQLETNMDRIILSQIQFNKVTGIANILNNQSITIQSKTFQIYPLTNIAISARKFVNHLFN